jgi:peptidyl-tRNA hydrolase
MLKMFIAIRRDILPLPHCAVQACHACAEFMHLHGQTPATLDWVNNDKTMILLSATESQIQQIKDLYEKLGLKYRTFIEPDMGNAETATAFEPMDAELGKKIFGHLPLLR